MTIYLILYISYIYNYIYILCIEIIIIYYNVINPQGFFPTSPHGKASELDPCRGQHERRDTN